MRARCFSRRVIGLFAAYLVAFQAFAMPLSMPQTAAPVEGLCLSDHSGGPAPHPAGHDCPCCAGCGLLCHAPALAGGAEPLPAPRLRLAARLAPAPLKAAPAVAVHPAQMPRGPPAA